MTYVLYGDKGSGAFCVEAALAEAEAPYRFETVPLDDNSQTSPEYLAINPSGKLPALKLPSGEIVTETAALLAVVAERHPEADLLPPARSDARAQALRWIAFLASEVYPMVEIRDYPERFAERDRETLRLRARDRIRERMVVVEKAAAGPWLLPGGFSAADIYAVMFTKWQAIREWPEAPLPKLKAMAAALVQRPKIAPVWKTHFG